MKLKPGEHSYHAAAEWHGDHTTKGLESNARLPEEPGTIHAIELGWTSPPIDTIQAHDTKRALCGTLVRVLYPVKFKIDDPDACKECAREFDSRTTARP